MSVALERIGDYRVIAQIGEGGMASVYLGVRSGPSNFTKLLVIKLLHADLAEKAEIVSMFLEEARIAARLNHANVVDTYEVGEDQGRHFIAMEYLQGQPFNAVLRRIGRETLPLAVQLQVLCEVLEGLHHVHELRDFDGARLGLVHRDVSPQNVFINYDGQVKLVDFGIAKAACSGAQTRAGVIKGKISYLAPEQASGGVVDHRADLFAVGVMLWEAIAKRRFTMGQIDAATIHNRTHGLEPRIRDVVPDAPAELARICDRAIELDPDNRFSSALELKHALNAYREQAGHRVDPREVGRMVAQAFASERLRIDRIIEDNTATAVMHTDGTPAAGDDLITSESVIPVPDETDPGRSYPERSKRVWWVGAAVVFFALALAATFYLGRATSSGVDSSSPAFAASAAEPSRNPAATSSKGSDFDTVRIRIRVRPDHAVLRLDGRLIQSNPFDEKLVRDGEAHRFEATAEGYQKETREIVFERDVQIEIVLRPASPEPVASATASGSAAPSTRDTRRPPAVGDDLRKIGRDKPAGPRRTIDSTDPYASGP